MMINGDLIWEVLDKRHRSIYNEKRGRDLRVAMAIVDEMEAQGWIRKQPNPNAARLDGWELTEQGRELATHLGRRKSQSAV
jgi:DNA-binding MarR family transcriptional regulator